MYLSNQNSDNLLILASFILVIIFSFLSLIKKLKQTSLKLTGLFFILIISLYAKNEWTYIFAILIAATTITNQEFLENIAAIFRGGIKEVYKYKVEKLNNEEKMDKLKQDISEEIMPEKKYAKKKSVTNVEITSNAVTSPKPIRIKEYQMIESLTLSKIEKIYGMPIEKYVRIQRNNSTVVFDGRVQRKNFDVLFEIKHVSNMNFLKDRVIPEMIKQVERYKTITGKPATLYLTIVNKKIKTGKSELKNELIEYSTKFGVNWGFFIFDYKDIDYKAP